MSQSPYAPPPLPSEGSINPNREKVRSVAKYQRLVIYALLTNILANVTYALTLEQIFPIRIIAVTLSLGVVVFAMISVFLLAREVFSTGVGVVCAILMIIPCVSLIVLLVVNQKATSFLQKNGVRVGFFGANPNSI